LIKELATYIAANTSLVIGTTLFAGEHPERMSNAAVVVLEKASPGVRSPHPELADMGQTPFRLSVFGAAGAGYYVASAVADALFTALHAKTQVELPVVAAGPTYLVNIACTTPFHVGRDENNRAGFVIYVTLSQQEV